MKWTKQDDTFLMDNTNIKKAVLSKLMGRTYNSVCGRFKVLGLKSPFVSSGVLPPKITFNVDEMTYRFRPVINGAIKNICKSHSLIVCMDNLDSYNEAAKAGFIKGDLL